MFSSFSLSDCTCLSLSSHSLSFANIFAAPPLSPLLHRRHFLHMSRRNRRRMNRLVKRPSRRVRERARQRPRSRLSPNELIPPLSLYLF